MVGIAWYVHHGRYSLGMAHREVYARVWHTGRYMPGYGLRTVVYAGYGLRTVVYTRFMLRTVFILTRFMLRTVFILTRFEINDNVAQSGYPRSTAAH